MSGVMHTASFNRGRLIADWGDPAVSEFEQNVERVNALAERSPGFVWRAGDDVIEAAFADGTFRPDPRLAATLAVWESFAHLQHFVFSTLHSRFLARRLNWFEPSDGPTHVMWPVQAGHRPSAAEAVERIDRLAREGAGPDAFDWTYAERRSAPAA